MILVYKLYKSVSKKAPTFMEEMNCELYIPLMNNT